MFRGMGVVVLVVGGGGAGAGAGREEGGEDSLDSFLSLVLVTELFSGT